MREGSLDAPTRHPVPWQDEAFYDRKALDQELHRVFDICHGCRRCFNLCDSFPKLFDLIDESETGELDSVDSKDFQPVLDACTLCDMCFMTKCPYVPPHEFNLDFPHLILRARAVEAREGRVPLAHREISKTDRNGKIAGKIAPLANWSNKCGNHLTRPLMEKTVGIDRAAKLPEFHSKTFMKRATSHPEPVNKEAPAFGRKAVIYATCFANYNNPDIGTAALQVLGKNGVTITPSYPGCCGMPSLEQGDLEKVANSAKKVAAELVPLIDQGHDIIALVPSCALMLKFEWPLLLPDDANIKKLSEATYDISEYIMDIAKNEGMADGMTPLTGAIAAHIACHARAQNMGQKAAQLLRLIPEAEVTVIERCSGHGGSWGIFKGNFQTALKVGKPVARQAKKINPAHVVSECPLARDHILQGMDKLDGEHTETSTAQHPIQLLARSYGF